MHAIVRHLISEIERQRTTCYVLLLKEKHRRRRSVFNGMEEEERIAQETFCRLESHKNCTNNYIFCVFLLIIAAFSEILVVIFVGSLFGASGCDPYGGDGCNYKDNLPWRMLPIYSQMYRIEPHTTPYVTPMWAYYIAIIGAALTTGTFDISCYFPIIQQCLTRSKLKQSRNKQYLTETNIFIQRTTQ